MNQAVNSPTGVEWPQVVENTPVNVELVNTIIQDCRVTTAGVTLTLISTDPALFLRHMHHMLAYLEAFNNDQVRTFNEVQVEPSYEWVKQVIRTSDEFKQLNRKKRSRLSFLVFRSLRDNRVLSNDLRLTAAQFEFINNLIQTTRRQIGNSRMYLTEEGHHTVNIEDCFRPEMAQSIKQYKLFTLVPMYSLTRKYVEIDYSHLRSLLLKVRRETQLELDDLRDESTDETRHDQAVLLFSQIFDFDKLRLKLH